MHFDVFNGDADGICALHQLRLSQPIPCAQLITGVKRDINLLARPELTSACQCTLNVFDISLDSNSDALSSLLQRENKIVYFDHHSARMLPQNTQLQSHIVFSPDTCTALIVNRYLQGQHAQWAVCGAFGDNLHKTAHELAASLALNGKQVQQLQEIGELMNYNGYGATLEDLHFHPADLYKAIEEFEDPLAFFHISEQLSVLRQGFNSDMDQALTQKAQPSTGKNRVYYFPDAPWARRVTGVFSNLKAREKVEAAHALITTNDDSTLQISVRAPYSDPRDADTLCRQFPTGGGRAGAAGINNLPVVMLDQFLAAFNSTYS